MKSINWNALGGSESDDLAGVKGEGSTENEVAAMNTLLSDALSGRMADKKPRADVAAVRIMSALRGPDTEDLRLKERFTSPIRLWVVGNNYDRVGYTHKIDPKPLKGKDHCVKLMLEAADLYKTASRYPWQSPNYHYIGHVCTALAAIAYLEGWEDSAFRGWFNA